RRAVLENHARRTLNLDCERVEWILDPANFKFLAIQRAGPDGAAVVVRHELMFLVEATDPRTFIWKCIGAGLVAGRHQVGRAAVKRHEKFRTGKARALNDRLVVAGQETLCFSETGDAHRLKILLEESASGRRILRPQG